MPLDVPWRRAKRELEFCDITYVTLRRTNTHQKLKGKPVSTILLWEVLRLIFLRKFTSFKFPVIV